MFFFILYFAGACLAFYGAYTEWKKEKKGDAGLMVVVGGILLAPLFLNSIYGGWVFFASIGLVLAICTIAARHEKKSK